jgi:hypothetical protein
VPRQKTTTTYLFPSPHFDQAAPVEHVAPVEPNGAQPGSDANVTKNIRTQQSASIKCLSRAAKKSLKATRLRQKAPQFFVFSLHSTNVVRPGNLERRVCHDRQVIRRDHASQPVVKSAGDALLIYGESDDRSVSVAVTCRVMKNCFGTLVLTLPKQ